MPTGLHDEAPLPALVGAQPRAAVNLTVRVLVVQTNIAQVFPGLVVPAGLSVSLRGHDGISGNVKPVRVAVYPEALSNNGGAVITPDTSINFPVDHLAQIWFAGQAGDGLIANISGVPIG